MMQVACAADDAFMPHCAAMLHSLLEKNRQHGVRVHFLADDSVSQENLSRMTEMVVAGGGEIGFPKISEDVRNRFPQNRRYGRVAWYRVLLPEILSDLARVLYLDADTIILDDLISLWNSDLQGCALGAVANPLYPFMDTVFLTALGVDDPADYFNSGVLLFNLDKWRERQISRQVVDFAEQHGAGQEWPDQNALNAVLRGDWRKLSPRWNAQNTVFDLPPSRLPFGEKEIRLAREHPAVLHFIGPYKPWHYRCKHRLRHKYWENLACTPWAGQHIEGAGFSNRLLRLLPEQAGWKLEKWLRNLI